MQHNASKHARHLLPGLLLGLLLGTANAHQIWLEPEGSRLNLHFGEYHENLKETSPGLLDRVPAPAVLIVQDGAAKAATAVKGKEGYALDATAGSKRHVVAEVRNYPVRELKQGETITRSKWIAAARFAPDASAQAARNLLDIVPNGAPGKFRVFFRGQPLAKAKVEMVAPNGWRKEASSNADGELELQPLWRGVYVLEVAHKEAVAGEVDGEKYDAASFTASLTIVNPDGPVTERPAAATPHQMK